LRKSLGTHEGITIGFVVMIMMGVGLLGFWGAIRRKYKNDQQSQRISPSSRNPDTEGYTAQGYVGFSSEHKSSQSGCGCGK